jgi:hypothetical protein
MSQKVNHKSEYRCDICNKYYASKSSLCNHNKKFHKLYDNNGSHNVVIGSHSGSHSVVISEQNSNNLLSCKYCNRLFQNRSNRWRHEIKCVITYNENKKSQDEIKTKELELKLKKSEAKILELKLKLEKSTNPDIMTLKQINRKLKERHNLIKNSTINIQNNNNDNKIINNYQLIGFGKEEIMDTLSKNEMKTIMNARYCCLEKLVEIVHFGKYNQFKNIIITNANNNYMYKYDDNKGYFVLASKSEVLNSLIDYRVNDIEVIYTEYLNNNKIDNTTKDIIEKFINRINSDENKFTDGEGKDHINYKQYKINEIKMLLFNNQDKITKDISLFLTTNLVDYIAPNELQLTELNNF